MAGGQAACRAAQNEVVVVVHQAKRHQFDVVSCERFEQNSYEEPPIVVVVKYVATARPLVEHVVDASVVNDPDLCSHAHNLRPGCDTTL